MRLREAVAADVFRHYGRFGIWILVKALATRRNLRVCITLRLCQAAARGASSRVLVLPLARMLHRVSTSLAAMDLPWNLDADVGLALTHGWGLVVAPGTRIGRNVTLFHGVTLGRRDRIEAAGRRTTGHPVIEDEVWLGPHAVVIGAVTVGRGSRIAAGAFVTADVPAFSVVVGNPAKVVRSNCTPDVMNPFC
jgi:serine O-acetyltransferase